MTVNSSFISIHLEILLRGNNFSLLFSAQFFYKNLKKFAKNSQFLITYQSPDCGRSGKRQRYLSMRKLTTVCRRTIRKEFIRNQNILVQKQKRNREFYNHLNPGCETERPTHGA